MDQRIKCKKKWHYKEEHIEETFFIILEYDTKPKAIKENTDEFKYIKSEIVH